MERAAILYDADCGFCRWSLARILAWDRRGRLRPVALQSPEADDLLEGMDPGRRKASWHLVAMDGRVRSGGAAVPQLARLLPAGAPIAALASAFPATTERLYRWAARHRSGLGRALRVRECAAEAPDDLPLAMRGPSVRSPRPSGTRSSPPRRDPRSPSPRR